MSNVPVDHRQLGDNQLEAFNTEYVTDSRWPTVKRRLDEDFPDGRFRFLDVGGGNGLFADRILGTYAQASGTVLDNGKVLLDRNQPNPRKTLLCASAEELGKLERQAYDVVFFNWVLHHLVGVSHRASQANIQRALASAIGLLRPRGRLSIFDNMYDGQILDWLPSRLIFQLTSSRIFAPIARRCGANTAGVGVCFLSKRTWDVTLARGGLRVLHFADEPPWKIPLYHRLLLHLGPVRFGHFWCETSRGVDSTGDGP